MLVVCDVLGIIDFMFAGSFNALCLATSHRCLLSLDRLLLRFRVVVRKNSMSNEKSSSTFYQSSSYAGVCPFSIAIMVLRRKPYTFQSPPCSPSLSFSVAPDGTDGRLRDHRQEGYSKYGSTFAASHGKDVEASSFYGESPPSVYAARSHHESGSITNGDRISSTISGPRFTLSSTVYATDAQGLYQDPNPQLIRRPTTERVQTYTQRVIVRFLKPPAVPPPGVSSSNPMRT